VSRVEILREENDMQLVIVTGMSGAGKSRVMDSLEDIGFFCVDNMTPKLIPTFVGLLNDSAEIFVEDETPKKDEKKGAGMGIATTISAMFGILLALVLFIYLPNLASGGIEALFHIDLGPWKAITSGVIKVIIFAVSMIFPFVVGSSIDFQNFAHSTDRILRMFFRKLHYSNI
jgi:hypothetical protein